MQRAVEHEAWAPQFFKFVLDQVGMPPNEILEGNMLPSRTTWDERATYAATRNMQPQAVPATPVAAY